ncbi:unnamed protein product [Phaedon cochleariae]|uniref:Uncharacterized protein n=1 Tax=Phaedon cochleariae TaxID=80249 RepID=A0A9N9SA28_PHACE|nr:unnamed protein product [Phaedon cochleariae]
MPDSPRTTDSITGECTIPKELYNFFTTLVCGVDRRPRQNVDKLRRVKSLCRETIYAVGNGVLRTSKHITLGMAMKSSTSSRKVIDISNRYGNFCSYNIMEELETEATFAASNSSTICPKGIAQSTDLCIGVAFDNFDGFVETSSGKDTLHDTVGIIFQNVSDTCNDDTQESANDNAEGSTDKSSTKRRRSFEAFHPELIPYSRRLKMFATLLPIDNPMRQSLPDNLSTISKKGLLCMLSHAIEVPNAPLWVGFNSKMIPDDGPKQKVTYLTPINISPTENSVVIGTMIQAQNAASECKQRYIQIIYDLAIAKVALEIQSTEHPRFENVFIHLGSFHIMMAYFYFKAVGKVIDDCGLSYMMIESKLLANNSVNGFISTGNLASQSFS